MDFFSSAFKNNYPKMNPLIILMDKLRVLKKNVMSICFGD